MPSTLLDPTEILATQMPPGKPQPGDGGGDVEPEEDEEEDDEEDG